MTCSSSGADRGLDACEFVDDLRERGATFHVAQNASKRSLVIDGRTTRHPSYVLGIRVRKRTEEMFAWGQGVGQAEED